MDAFNVYLVVLTAFHWPDRPFIRKSAIGESPEGSPPEAPQRGTGASGGS
ncbi:MAG: hypothetical protein PHF72_09930 [Gammaproteobacteria bacterium]|nr:hypothetical protein [Gammaproteobacteria bacterium]